MMAGRWMHNWVPLDAIALKEKYHGHVPAGREPGMTHHHGTGLPELPPGHMHVYDVQTGKMRVVTKAEAAAGHQRYGQLAFKAGSPARAVVEKRAMELAREASGKAKRSMAADWTRAWYGFWLNGHG